MNENEKLNSYYQLDLTSASKIPALGSRLKVISTFFLAMILYFSTAGNLKAADAVTSGTCGDNCTWSFSGETLTVVGTIQNYSDGIHTPWSQAGLAGKIKTIDASACTGLGSSSFESLKEATKVIMPKDITKIPAEAFRSCKNIKNIEVPDGVTMIEILALSKMHKLESITIPDTARFNDTDIFTESNRLTNIYCKGDISECQDHLNNLGLSDSVKVLTAPEDNCNSELFYYTGKTCEHRPENPENLVCTGGYAKLKNNCVDPLKTFAKKHYTPAEANQWLNDNNNTVTIIFKK